MHPGIREGRRFGLKRKGLAALIIAALMVLSESSVTASAWEMRQVINARSDQAGESGLAEETARESEAGADADSDQAAGNNTVLEADPGSESGRDTETDPAAESGGESENNAEKETARESDAGTKTDQSSEAGAGANSDQSSETGADAKQDPATGTGTEIKPDQTTGTDTETKPDQTAGAGAETKPDQAAGTGTETKPNQETGTGAVSESDPASETASSGAEARQAGTGTVSESEETDHVFQVILPVGTDDVFDFILDPQQLITKTEAAAYEGSRFEEGATLFFRHSDKSAEETYSSSSDALTIINKGSAPVEVELTASVVPDSLGGIVMTDDRDFIDDTDPSLYLALTDGDQTVAIDEEYGASICVTVDGVSDGDEKGSSYSFRLTGAVNGNGDWSELTDAAPKVIVTWMVTADEEMEREDDSSLRSHGRDSPFCRE